MSNVCNATPTLNLPQLLQEILVTHFIVNIAACAFLIKSCGGGWLNVCSLYKCGQVVLTGFYYCYSTKISV